jgi:hypothetical protein
MYAEGYFPDAYRIGGMRMQPMTMGHVLLIERVAPPFAPWRTTEERIGSGSIMLFVAIVTRSWRDAAVVLERPSWVWRWKANRITRRVNGDPRAVATVEAYLKAQVNLPDMTRWMRDNLTTTGAEMSHALMVTLMQLGATRAEAMDTPLRLALWDQAFLQEQNGAVSLESDGSGKTEAKRKAIEDLERRLACQTKP